MIGGGFNKFFHWLFHDALVDRLARSQTFQRIALRIDSFSKQVDLMQKSSYRQINSSLQQSELNAHVSKMQSFVKEKMKHILK
jgi:hypothetical protein